MSVSNGTISNFYSRGGYKKSRLESRGFPIRVCSVFKKALHDHVSWYNSTMYSRMARMKRKCENEDDLLPMFFAANSISLRERLARLGLPKTKIITRYVLSKFNTATMFITLDGYQNRLFAVEILIPRNYM